MPFKILTFIFIFLAISCGSSEGEGGPSVSSESNTATVAILNILEPVNGSYAEGSELIFQVNYANPVIVTGTPRMALNIGGNLAYADYVSGSGSIGIEFKYTVSSGENDSDGISLATSSIDLNSGTMKNSSDEDADLGILPHMDSLVNILVNTSQAAPDQVTGVSTAPTTSNDTLQLAWSTPSNNGTALTHYVVQYREKGNASWLNHSPNPTTSVANISGLSAGTTYEFRVAASNGVLGLYSSISEAEIFDISSLNPIAWLSATDITNGGTEPNNGDKVASWSDLTGVAGDATESNSADQPTYETNVQNGLPAIRFDGTADRGLEGTFTRSNNGGLTVILVGQFDFINPRRAMFEFYQDGSPDSGSSSRRGFFFSYGFNEASSNMGLTSGGFNIWSAYDDGSQTTLSENGVNLYTNNANHFGSTEFSGLGRYVLGDDKTGGDKLEGYIGELLIFDRQLTTDEMTTLETYLQNKWGL